MKVREVIAELIKHDMEAEFFIGLGPHATPSGHSKVQMISDYVNHMPQASGGKCPFGVYIIPTDHLEEADNY